MFAGRAFWLLLLAIGLLTGQSFISAVNSYAEASGIGGGAAALAQGLSPLDGILVPTLGAYDLAITLLFPFVAIRLVAGEKASDALKVMLQWPSSLAAQIGAKVVALIVAWLIALVPFAIAVALWTAYGGHLCALEVVNLLTGYTLRFLMTAGVAAAAAALMHGAANAAIAVLALTIGTWALDFLATGRGGLWQRIASFTPTAATRTFERGLFRVDVVLVLAIVALLGFAVATIALRLGAPMRVRAMRAAAAIVIAAAATVAASFIHASADVSENRRSSFAPAQEQLLRRIDGTLDVTIFLAAEDPRMSDFDRNVLVKLRRSVRRVDVHYPFAGQSALFENDPRYGEIHYALGGRKAVSRSTTEEIVVETIAQLAGMQAPPPGESGYPGYPLPKRPAHAAWIFYAAWPAVVLSVWSLRNRRIG